MIRQDSRHLSHNNNSDCTSCHQHNKGFFASCSACHGNPPVDAETLVRNPGVTGSVTAGAHAKHATPSGMNYRCDTCHSGGMPATPVVGNNKIQIGFNLFGGLYTGAGTTYQGQTLTNGFAYEYTNGTVQGGTAFQCTNLDRHGATMDVAGDKNGGSNITPAWNNPATGACGTCHGATAAAPPKRGSHRTHTMNDAWSYAPNDVPPFNNYIYGRNLACSVCHNNPADKHVNGAADWSFDSATYPRLAGALYKGLSSGEASPVPGTYGQCSNLYCHSIIQTATGGPLTGLPGEYKNPTGNRTEGNSGTCHAVDAGHAYWAGLTGSPPEINTGSHSKHLEMLGYDAALGPTPGGPGRCAVCHNYVGSDALNGCASVRQTQSGRPACQLSD